ncbi:MAG: efflux RND transporter periplasmic adaptor subunit, partial [Burkholderiaceae bacterium]|nr:efflux RND transporter periplasmic adaptor subunit [Burkholderiaceae bacterium]
MKKSMWMASAMVLALAGGGAGWWWTQQSDSSAVAWRTGVVERGSLQATVSASGTVNPVTQVSVGSQVSGQVRQVLVDFNAEVKAGQLIAEIDPETFEYRVRSAQADLDAARASVLTAQANAAASRAAISRAQTDLAEARRVHERNQQLVAQAFIAQSEADRTRAVMASAEEGVKAAQAQLGVSAAQITTAQAIVAQREAVLAQARVDLGRTQIKSPVNGIVIKRTVERGQTVAASLQAPELFVIAQNLSDMQVDASIDEADVGRIRPGQKATFTVDAFPGQTFEGQVNLVRKAGQNVSNVVTYVAVIAFSNATGRLLPGMTANVRVVTDVRADALKVPNAALRVRLPGVEPAKVDANTEANKPTPSSVEGQKDTKNAGPTASAAAPGVAAGGAASAAPGAAAGPAGALAEFRQRLVTELALDAAQQQKVDAIYTAARPEFGKLRELPEDQRAKARERVLADIRAQVGDVLTPEQRPKYAALVAESAGRQTTRGRLFVPGADGKAVAYDVRLGLTDGTSTELIVP